MAFGKKLLDFLFGKDPLIFDDKGNVSHNLPLKKWQDWQDRYKTPQNNWRHHVGAKTNSNPKN